MNTLQASRDRVQHLCPMQFDIADRLITRFSMKGEVVFDPFGGLEHRAARSGEARASRARYGTVAAGTSRRRCATCALDQKRATPTPFDLGPSINSTNDAE